MKNLTAIVVGLLLSLSLFSQKVSNVRFEQLGKEIHIYYDLEGDQKYYSVSVFCSFDGGQNWGNALKYVHYDIGGNQSPGKNKVIVWDVLQEKAELLGSIQFKITANKNNWVTIQNSPNEKNGIFIDKRDGQTYKWVKIGEQVWMSENLNFIATDSWWYKNNNENSNKYGRIYKWKTALSACPDGWHLPRDDDWKVLEMYLGISRRDVGKIGWRGTDEGKKLKSISDWYSEDNGIDAVFFSAFPGGFRNTFGNFNNKNSSGCWWSATESNASRAWNRCLYYKSDEIERSTSNKGYGFSVRCVKD